MSDFPQNSNLPIDPLPIVLLLNYLLVQYFNRHLLVSQDVCSLLNLPESPLSYCFTLIYLHTTYCVITYFFLRCASIHIINIFYLDILYYYNKITCHIYYLLFKMFLNKYILTLIKLKISLLII